MNKTMTVDEVAAYLRVEPITVQRELRRGRLPGNRVGKAWRLTKADLDEYLRGGDPTAAIFKASVRLQGDHVDEALRLLLRSVIADRLVPPDLRLALLKRIGILAEAEETGSAKRAREAAFAPDAPPWLEERSGSISLLRVPINVVWNKHVVEPFAESLARRKRKKKSPSRRAKAPRGG
jgi:excisionase family DNA binding protein